MGKIEKMVQCAIDIAEDDRHGYSQVRRWPSQGTDFDCSSLMYYCAHEAGYDVPLSGYTGTMLDDFMNAGFTALTFDGCITDLDAGDIMLHEQNHTEMYIGNGKFVGAHIAETGGIDGRAGDQTGDEISIVNAYVPSYGWDYVLVPPKESTVSKPAAKKALCGIDVSSNQDVDVCAKVNYDFAIVKMSGNPPGYPWSYVNPHAKHQCDDAVKRGKPVGLYHFGYGKDAQAEAEYFIKQVKSIGYLSKAMLVLDYEDDCTNRGRSWVQKFLKRVEELAGYKPVLYASGSVIVEQNLFALGYPVWCASYRDYEPVYGYDTSGMSIYPGCEKALMWQFTSEGYLSGYSGRLDLNKFFGSLADFTALTGAKKAAGTSTAKLVVDGIYGAKTRAAFEKAIKGDKAKVKALQKALNAGKLPW